MDTAVDGAKRDLEWLAGQPELFERREALQRLARALGDPDNADTWSGVSLREHLGGPVTARPGPVGVARMLDAARMVLIFAPVLSTWFGLYRASSAYTAYLDTKPAVDQGFFREWLGGFGGTLDFSFPTMAVVTCLLVVAFLLVNWLVAGTEARAKAREEQRLGELEGKLAAALLDASLVLSRRRLSSEPRFREEMTKTAASLNHSIRRLNELQSAVTEALVEARELLTSTRAAAAGVADVATGLEASLASLHVAVADVVSRGDSRDEFLQGRLAAMAEVVSSSANDQAERFERLTETMVGSVASSSLALTTGVERSSAWVVSKAEELADVIARLSSDHGGVSREAAAAMQATGARLAAAVEAASRDMGDLVFHLRQAPLAPEHNGVPVSAGVVDLVHHDGVDDRTSGH